MKTASFCRQDCDDVAAMMFPGEIAEAQRLASDWKPE
jgi:hypothetical protein